MHMPAARANWGGGNAFRCEHFDQRAAGNNICNGIKRTDLVKMHKINGNTVGMTLRFCNQFVNSKGMLLTASDTGSARIMCSISCSPL